MGSLMNYNRVAGLVKSDKIVSLSHTHKFAHCDWVMIITVVQTPTPAQQLQ